MALVKNSIVVTKLSGTLGGIVFKQYRYGTVASKIPDMSKIKRSEKQKAAIKEFSNASVYASHAIKDPEKRKAFQEKRARDRRHAKRSLYHLAMDEYYEKAREKRSTAPLPGK